MGLPGPDGKPGLAGPPGKFKQIISRMAIVLCLGAPGRLGINGLPGIAGMPGPKGLPVNKFLILLIHN